jgi:hypothetical protein
MIEVQQDGLTYVLTMTEPIGPAIVEQLMREGPNGWYLTDVVGDYFHLIGRRKSWQKALHDALVLMEIDLKRIQKQ